MSVTPCSQRSNLAAQEEWRQNLCMWQYLRPTGLGIYILEVYEKGINLDTKDPR